MESLESQMELRGATLERIAATVGKTAFSDSDTLLVPGDAEFVLSHLPSHSVSLILTDPPYHATKKMNILGDTRFKRDEEYLEWIDQLSRDWHRVLGPNGSLFMFCDSTMAARLEVLLSERFNILNQIVWTKPNDPGFDGWKGKMKKENLRQWYPHSERAIFATPAVDGNLHRSSFGDFLRRVRKQAGLSGHQLTEQIGAYGRVNHGGAVSNWEAGRNTPSRQQYRRICEAILATGRVQRMPAYEDVIRPFFVTKDQVFTDVWEYPSVRPYRGKHPAEKPITMLEDIIRATTFPEDIVLDCFAGSGSTAVAAINTNRKSVSIELSEEWVEAIKTRIRYLQNHGSIGKNSQNGLPPSDGQLVFA